MNFVTDTRFVIPDAETRKRIDQHHNTGNTIYEGRHATEVRAAFTPVLGRHHVDDSLTRVIPPAQIQAVAATSTPAPPTAVATAPVVEPPAAVDDGLLARVLRGLRALRVVS